MTQTNELIGVFIYDSDAAPHREEPVRHNQDLQSLHAKALVRFDAQGVEAGVRAAD